MKTELSYDWQEITTIMENEFSVVVPPESDLITIPPEIAIPTLFVVTELVGVTTSYMTPNIETESNPEKKQLPIAIPHEITLLCQAVRTCGGKAVLVGGIIRDAVYTEITNQYAKPKDFDIELYGLDLSTVEKLLRKIFPDTKIDTVGKSYGIIKVYLDTLDEPLDIAVPRVDFSTGVGHTEFISVTNPGMTLKQASRRRDMRMNTLSYDPLLETLYDPYLGKIDLQNKHIAITDAETFSEDPLRVLRVMQFAGRFEMQPTAETTALCKQMVIEGSMDSVAQERIRDELLKLLLKSKKPSIGLAFAKEIGFVDRYWQELCTSESRWSETLAAVDTATTLLEGKQLDSNNTVLILLAVLCNTLAETEVETFLEKLKLKSIVKKQVTAIVVHHKRLKRLLESEAAQTTINTADINKIARELNEQVQLSLRLVIITLEATIHHENNPALSKLHDLEQRDVQVPEPLLSVPSFLKEIGEKNNGPWLGIIIKCIKIEQDEGCITTAQEAHERASFYLTQLKSIFAKKYGDQHYAAKKYSSFWAEFLKNPDPRVALFNSQS